MFTALSSASSEFTITKPYFYSNEVRTLLDQIDDQDPEIQRNQTLVDTLSRLTTEFEQIEKYMDQHEWVGCAASCQEIRLLYSQLDQLKDMVPASILQQIQSQAFSNIAVTGSHLQLMAKQFFTFSDTPERLELTFHQSIRAKTLVKLKDYILALETMDHMSFIVKAVGCGLALALDCIVQGSKSIQIKKTPFAETLVLVKKDTRLDTREFSTDLRDLIQFIHGFLPQMMSYYLQDIQQAVDKHILSCKSRSEAHAVLMELEYEMLDKEITEEAFVPAIEDIDSVSRENARLDVLETAMTILRSSDNNTVVVQDATERGGLSGLLGIKYGKTINSKKTGMVDPEFQLHQIRISWQAQAIVEMIHQTLQQLGTDSTRNAELLIQTRDMAALYRSFLKRKLQNGRLDHSNSIIVYNDCEYMCHHFGVLSTMYGDALTPDLKTMGSFVDEFVLFQDYGQKVLEQKLEQEREYISQHLTEWRQLGKIADYIQVFASTIQDFASPNIFKLTIQDIVTSALERFIEITAQLSDTIKKTHEYRFIISSFTSLSIPVEWHEIPNGKTLLQEN
ncbi:hypothetical protein EDD86DRAFT_198772 [Gorgonomyces haynaldii]|nr:hypothetical protein EDD86DRAFT_198772 [Gorgonomyces haynaldii]